VFALRRAGRLDRRHGGDAAGFVLPRLLRRPARAIARIFRGEVEAPRHAALALNTALILSSVAYGAYAGGHMPAVMQAVTARTGFAVDQVKVIGNRETSEIDVLDRLQLDGWTSLIGMNVDAARERISSLPWVSTVSVRKTYPDTIEVRLDERAPFAIWQQNGQLAVIESSGQVIAPYRPGSLSDLPVVVGEGAERAAAFMVSRMEAYPDLKRRARVFVRVGGRRWDITFDSGVVVMLPEFGVGDALVQLQAMQTEQDVLAKDIASLDLRLSDRIVMRLNEDAAEKRQADLKQKPGKRT
jgi:cell division protein FtsQ